MLRIKLNRVDFWIFDVGGESDGEFSVGDFHRHGFDVGASSDRQPLTQTSKSLNSWPCTLKEKTRWPGPVMPS